MRNLLLVAVLGAAAALPLGCEKDLRALPDPSYRDDVAAILEARCVRCHAGEAPAGGFRAESYRDVIGCTAGGAPLVLPADAPPMLLALERADHRDIATPDERETLARWIRAGAQGVRPGVHPAGFADPRSPSGHAAFLRGTRYRPMTDPSDKDACRRCHESTPAPGATACVTCHTEPGGANACSTCHGQPGRGSPPRDACFFGPTVDAHAAHTAPSRSRAEPLDCSSCHPKPTTGGLEGAHGDGTVEVWFDHALAGRTASFDATTKTCTGSCHDRGGSAPAPSWKPASLDCTSCHASPPAAHYPGACNACHREANAEGTALASPHLHVNGKVDLGDGNGTCGACHGVGTSPWPTTGAHAAHRAPAGAAPVLCETCHALPGANDAHPLRAGAAVVRLAGLATKGGSPATYDPTTKTCAATYCHEGRGGTRTSVRWNDTGSSPCSSCHGVPPPAPHTADLSCGAASCHEGIVTGGVITAGGASSHVDGIVDRRTR